MLISIVKRKIFTIAIKKIDAAMIDADADCGPYKLKRSYVIAISIRDLEYLGENKAGLKTDSSTAILAKY